MVSSTAQFLFVVVLAACGSRVPVGRGESPFRTLSAPSCLAPSNQALEFDEAYAPTGRSAPDRSAAGKERSVSPHVVPPGGERLVLPPSKPAWNRPLCEGKVRAESMKRCKTHGKRKLLQVAGVRKRPETCSVPDCNCNMQWQGD